MPEKTNEPPFTMNGEPDGPPSAARARPEPEAGTALPAAEESHTAEAAVPRRVPGAIQAALAGEPGTLPPTWCRKCEAEVQPVDKGKCPRCGTFLRLNFSARKHPVNKLRRQQLLDKFLDDYRPTTQLLVSTCEQLASIVEQLEVLKPGSPDHQRLVQLSQLLGETLEASRAARSTLPVDYQSLDEDQLVARCEALLASAIEARDAKRRDEHVAGHSVEEGHAQAALESTSEPALEQNDASTTHKPSTKTDASPVAQVCDSCGLMIDGDPSVIVTTCTSLRKTDRRRWEVLHRHDPRHAADIEQREAERKQREDEEEFAQMLRSMGRTYD